MLLVGFGLAAAGLVSSSSGVYLILNMLGASGMALASLSKRAYSPAALNLVWAVIAALSLLVLAAHLMR
jgi:hypothetical protein